MRFLIWTVLLLLSLVVFAQSEHNNFSKLDFYNGLSHNQVNAILKDADGFLWFGTMSGLNRYDGYSFKIYRKKPDDSSSLYDNYILSLHELPDGKMWVNTRGGHCIYNSHTEKFDADYYSYLHSLGLPSGSITDIVKGQNGRYWFLTIALICTCIRAQIKVQNHSGSISNSIFLKKSLPLKKQKMGSYGWFIKMDCCSSMISIQIKSFSPVLHCKK
jgi:ligand-binding sensor domain-containing protein